MYLLIKKLHVIFALISVSGFFVRGILVMRQSPVMQQKWIRIVPHINDTLLLVSAIFLAWQSAQYPFVDHWLTAKVLALLAYIFLGIYTLKKATSFAQQMLGFILSLVVFAYIVLVAITKSAVPF
ncbi:MAG: SirB2 family protein [Pseudomonadota bacterium]